MYAATSTEKQEWMAHINKCIEDLLRKSMTVSLILLIIVIKCYIFVNSGGKKPVEKHAAVWVPDNEANVCMHCKKTQFTMIVRRVRNVDYTRFPVLGLPFSDISS